MRTTPSTSQKRTEDSLSQPLTRYVRPNGTRKKRLTASASAATIVNAQTFLGIGSAPSGSCALALISSALKPIDIDWARATTPRTTGQRSALLRLTHETTG